MKNTNRRIFLENTVKGLTAAFALSGIPAELLANPGLFKDFPIGFQTFAVRDRLSKDFPGTMKAMKDLYVGKFILKPTRHISRSGFLTGNMSQQDQCKLIAFCSCISYIFGGFPFRYFTAYQYIRFFLAHRKYLSSPSGSAGHKENFRTVLREVADVSYCLNTQF